LIHCKISLFMFSSYRTTLFDYLIIYYQLEIFPTLTIPSYLHPLQPQVFSCSQAFQSGCFRA
jgi:hypothetical protein